MTDFGPGDGGDTVCETSVYMIILNVRTHRTIRLNMQEDGRIHNYRCEGLKSYIYTSLL
jgi:hypothetical protein